MAWRWGCLCWRSRRSGNQDELGHQDWRQGGGAVAQHEDPAKWTGGWGHRAGDGGPSVRGDAARERSANAADDDGQGQWEGDWDVACEREAGDRLVFDPRSSLREMGGATLFRWAPTGGVVPNNDDAIYTAVADCRAKSIEATWPGKRKASPRSGTCGRHSGRQPSAPRAARSRGRAPEPDRTRRARGGAAQRQRDAVAPASRERIGNPSRVPALFSRP